MFAEVCAFLSLTIVSKYKVTRFYIYIPLFPITLPADPSPNIGFTPHLHCICPLHPFHLIKLKSLLSLVSGRWASSFYLYVTSASPFYGNNIDS